MKKKKNSKMRLKQPTVREIMPTMRKFKDDVELDVAAELKAWRIRSKGTQPMTQFKRMDDDKK